LKRLRTEMKISPDSPFDGVQDDLALYRFLKAKKWDYEVAKAQYKKMREYRVEEKVDEIFDWAKENAQTVELIESLYPTLVKGFDKGGRPIVYQTLGAIPAARFAKLISLEDLHKFHTLFMENIIKLLLQRSKDLGKPIYQVTAIIDMGGASLESRHFVPYFKDMSKQDEQNYPEIVNAVYVVNSPWVFPYLYGLVKHFIDPNTREKISVFSSKFEKELLKDIDVKVLNVKYGGEDTEKIPEIKGVKMRDCNEEATELNVAARDSFETISNCRDKKGGKFEWFFELDSLDINFKVEWKGSKDKKFLLIEEKERVSKDNGSYTVKGKGELKITFDNSYSYLTSKDVRYAVIYNSTEMLKTQRELEARQLKESKRQEKMAKKRAKQG